MRVNSFGFAAWLLCSGLCAVARADPAGFVLEMSGGWELQDGELAERVGLHQGQTVTEGGKIVRTSAGAEDFVTVVLLNGEILRADLTNPAVTVPKARANPPNLPSRILTVLTEAFSHHQQRYAVTIARGGAGQLAEGVVLLQEGGIDLAPVFAGMAAGVYLVAIVPAEVEELGEPRRFVWQAKNGGRLDWDGLTVGLHSMALLKRDGVENLPTGDEAWILVCAPETFEAARGAFQEFVNLTAGWPKSVSPAGKRAFLRASLEAISAKPAS